MCELYVILFSFKRLKFILSDRIMVTQTPIGALLTGYFSAAKAALDMQMSVSPSVSQSITLIFLSDLLVYFIIANRTEMKH